MVLWVAPAGVGGHSPIGIDNVLATHLCKTNSDAAKVAAFTFVFKPVPATYYFFSGACRALVGKHGQRRRRAAAAAGDC